MERGLLVGVEIYRDRVLGSGAYGEVYEGTYGRTPVAVKHVKATTVESRAALQEALVKEAEVWSKLQHPNVVQFYGIHKEQPTGDDGDDGELYLVSELMDGSLVQLLQEEAEREEDGEERLMSDAALLAVCSDVALAMEHLAREGVVHGDLAARNVLYTRSRDGNGLVCKVSDFGLACCGGLSGATLSYSLVERSHVPIRWSAPEVLKRGQYSSASDVWSMAVLFWEVFSLGDVPFGAGMSNAEVVTHVTSQREGAVLERPHRCPSEIYGLMTQCWVRGRKNRISVTDLRMSIERILGKAPTDVPSARVTTAPAEGGGDGGLQEKNEKEEKEEMTTEETVQAVSLAKAAMEHRDFESAATLFQKAATAGSASAQGSLGHLYFEGKGVEKNLAEAFRWFWAGASGRDGPAMRGLGEMYLKGLFIEKDEEQGALWLEQAHEQGDSLASLPLAGLYLDGIGVTADPRKAEALASAFPDSEDARYIIAMASYAHCDSWGQMGMMKSFANVSQLSDQGHVKGSYAASMFPATGLPFMERKLLREKRLKYAADQGFPPAEYRWATFKARRDPAAAAEFLEKAAAHGYPRAVEAMASGGVKALQPLHSLVPTGPKANTGIQTSGLCIVS